MVSTKAPFCPECDDSHIRRATRSNYRWRCVGCGARFEDPVYRETGEFGFDHGSLARKLQEMDPDAVGGEL